MLFEAEHVLEGMLLPGSVPEEAPSCIWEGDPCSGAFPLFLLEEAILHLLVGLV